MKRVLIIADNLKQQERLQRALQPDRTVHVTTLNLEQINPRRLRTLRKTDLIILEDTPDDSEKMADDDLLSVLQMTGIPIMLLPPPAATVADLKEPLVLNLTERNIAKPGLVTLLNRLRSQFLATTTVSRELSAIAPARAVRHPTNGTASSPSRPSTPDTAKPVDTKPIHQQIAEYNKILQTLTSIRRISHQLREPLSNMNLAIHMLGQMQSVADRDRYLKLLREEYNRELQLLNQLDDLQSNLPPAV